MGSAAPLKARGVGITDVGLQRDHNEDTFAVLQRKPSGK